MLTNTAPHITFQTRQLLDEKVENKRLVKMLALQVMRKVRGPTTNNKNLNGKHTTTNGSTRYA